MDEKVIEKNNKNNMPKWKKIIKKILNVVFIVLLVLLLILVVSGFIDKISQYNSSLFGYRFSVISSQSMSFVNDSNKERLKDYHDQYAKGTIIVANNYKSYDDVNINDVILYYNGSLLVCHRVVEKKEENNKYYVITQGDANSTTDGLIDYKNVKGKVVGSCPYLGYVPLYIQSPYGLLAFSSVVFIYVCYAFGSYYIDKKKHKDENKNIQELQGNQNETIEAKIVDNSQKTQPNSTIITKNESKIDESNADKEDEQK